MEELIVLLDLRLLDQITHLTNAKDHERLTLLKEVAGTHVYEQRRRESIKIMDETGESKIIVQRSMLRKSALIIFSLNAHHTIRRQTSQD